MDAEHTEAITVVDEDIAITKYDNALYALHEYSAGQDCVSSQTPACGELSLVNDEAPVTSSIGPKLDVVVERELLGSYAENGTRSQDLEQTHHPDSSSSGGGHGRADTRNRTQTSSEHRSPEASNSATGVREQANSSLLTDCREPGPSRVLFDETSGVKHPEPLSRCVARESNENDKNRSRAGSEKRQRFSFIQSEPLKLWSNRVTPEPAQESESGSPYANSRSPSIVSKLWNRPSVALSRRSSMKGSAVARRGRRKKHVRFAGVSSSYKMTILGFLIPLVRSGSVASTLWEFCVAIGTCADLMFLPLNLLGQLFHHHEVDWRASFNSEVADHLSNKFLLFKHTELWIDVLFVSDLFYRLGRAFMKDLGYDDSPVERLVNAAPTQPPEDLNIKVKPKEEKDQERALAVDMEGNRSTFGRYRIGKFVRWQLAVAFPVRLLLMSLEWIVLLSKTLKLPVSIGWIAMAGLARLYRLCDLWAYFTAQQEDIATDVRWVAFFKFAFIIVTTAHWLGCTYYALGVWFVFHDEQYLLNWVDAWAQQTFIDYDWRTSNVCFTFNHLIEETYDYVVMLFKGFSMLTNLGYETAVPELLSEMVASLIAQNVKVVIDAYILGTLFHYIVKKDPEVEAAKELMQGLRAYSSERQLPPELASKMEAYIAFQQKHSSAVANHVRNRLPVSLQARIAEVHCRPTINRNMHMFASCNQQFLSRFMMMLAEVSVMPGEGILQQGDMARELSFAIKGTLVVSDNKGTLVDLISGEGTSPCIVGAVSFLLGVPEPFNVSARENSDTALLVLRKSRYDGVISHYPEQSDIILTNLLYQYGLTRDGQDVGQQGRNIEQTDDEGFANLRSEIQAELQRSQETALAELTYAASVGNIDQVQNLLARGLPVNAGVLPCRVHNAATK